MTSCAGRESRLGSVTSWVGRAGRNQPKCENLMNIVEYFEMRRREVEEQLEAIESGRVLRLVCETKTGAVDVTEQEKQRLRQTSKDYWRAAENLRRINSSQK